MKVFGASKVMASDSRNILAVYVGQYVLHYKLSLWYATECCVYTKSNVINEVYSSFVYVVGWRWFHIIINFIPGV